MCALQSTTRSRNLSSTSRSDDDFGETSWDDVKIQPLIDRLCDTIPLSAVFKRYGITFEQVDSSSGWSYQRLCPFKDHQESSPSFGYNEQQDTFNCFGCGRGGRSVHFIAFYEDLSIETVAKKLSKNFDVSIAPVRDTIDYAKLDLLMVKFSNAARQFIKSHDDNFAMEYFDSICLIYDRCVASIKRTHDLDYLEFLIDRLVEKFLLYGDADGDSSSG